MEISIRVATMEDIPALQKLIPESARALSQGYYTPQQIESAIKYIFGVDTQLIADRTYYLAQAKGDALSGEAISKRQVVGCGGWSKRQTLYGGDQMKAEADPLLDPEQDAGRIRAFFIHPNWSRKGIGRRIIEACEEAAKADGFTRMELGATLPGEPLYAAMGYEVTDRFDIPMGDGTTLPCAHMKKELTQSC